MGYFIEDVLSIKDATQKQATHYVICNGGKIRYLIAVNNRCAKKRLAANISAYSGKLNILMKLLCILPYGVLSAMKLGKYVEVTLADQVKSVFEKLECDSWNAIIGSYVEKQKIVLQCFETDNGKEAIYIKIGGETSENEMMVETAYLKEPIKSSIFYSPKVLFAQNRKDGHPFNIQVTDEFSGEKVPPIMTEEIYQIFKEISKSKPEIQEDGVTKVFSHGDFTPWNMKKNGNKYVVFDWEYAGYRFYGFDLIHYLWQVENKLNKKEKDIAMRDALLQAKAIDKKLSLIQDSTLYDYYFHELHKQFGSTL